MEIELKEPEVQSLPRDRLLDISYGLVHSLFGPSCNVDTCIADGDASNDRDISCQVRNIILGERGPFVVARTIAHVVVWIRLVFG